jgi:hypothetical protein
MAAGLGYKEFTTGDVLTAADANGYLASQVVMVFASAAARTSAIASPQEGMISYLKDTDALNYYSGSAWTAIDDSNAIQNTIVDAKGDLIAASAADTPARLAVGANDTMLVGDSTAATGLSYKSAATLYPWQAFTPTYNNFTIGNATVVARYQQIGKLVNVFYSAIWGSTTAFTSYPQIFLPVTAARSGYTTGKGYLQDTGVGSFDASILIETTTYFQFAVTNTSGTYGTATFLSANTIPFTWTNTDQMVATFSYEAA